MKQQVCFILLPDYFQINLFHFEERINDINIVYCYKATIDPETG